MVKAAERLGFGRKDAYIMAILFALAFAIRFYFRSAGLLHTDSVIEAKAAQDAFVDGRLHYLQGLGYPGESLLMTLTYGAFRLFGADSAEQAVIFASVLFGALCVPMIYALSKRLFDSELAGIYSALILTLLPVQLSLSTFGKGHGMELFFLLLSAYLAVRAGERGTFGLRLAAGLALGFTMAIRQTSAMALPAVMLLFWWANPPAELLRKKGALKLRLRQPYTKIILDAATLSVPVLAVFVASFVPLMLYDPSYSLLGSIKAFSQEANTGFSPFSPLMTKSLEWATVSVTPLGWLLAAGGAFIVWRRDKLLAAALLLWFVILFVYLSNVGMVSPRFVIPALAVPVMLAAVAVEHIGDAVDLGRRQAAALIVLVILSVWMMANIYPVLEYRRLHCGPCDFSRAIANATEQNAAVIAMDESNHYEYYAHRRTLGHPSGPDLADPAKLEASLDQLEGLLRNGTPVYITTQGLSYDGLPENTVDVDRQTMNLVNTKEGKTYAHLKFDPQKRMVVDAQTGVAISSPGIYSIELFDRFRVLPILQTENEDWHHSCIENAIYPSTLYRISLRQQA
jgi:hypothetical protein